MQREKDNPRKNKYDSDSDVPQTSSPAASQMKEKTTPQNKYDSEESDYDSDIINVVPQSRSHPASQMKELRSPKKQKEKFDSEESDVDDSDVDEREVNGSPSPWWE